MPDWKGAAQKLKRPQVAIPVGALAVTGNAFKLKNEDDGYWTNWTGLGTPTVSADLTPLQ